MTAGPDRVHGRYLLGRTLGAGGMGRVWQARDEVLHREVAVKQVVLPRELDDASLLDHTLREARAAARVSHPGVARVHDAFEWDGRAWIVMEYVPSRSLQEVLEADGPLPPAEVARIGLAVLAALEAAHARGVRHRDIKPGNVLLATDGRVVLTDFGVAAIDGETLTAGAGPVIGSPQYMAPERVVDGATSPAADLWSLGATLYAAVEGHSPYPHGSVMDVIDAVANDDPEPTHRAGPLRPVLAGLLDRNPGTRIAATEARRRLRTAERRARLTATLSRPSTLFRRAPSPSASSRRTPINHATPDESPAHHAPPDHPPVDHALVDHAPLERAPSDAALVVHAPSETAPSDAAPLSHAPSDAASLDHAPSDVAASSVTPHGPALSGHAPSGHDDTASHQAPSDHASSRGVPELAVPPVPLRRHRHAWVAALAVTAVLVLATIVWLALRPPPPTRTAGSLTASLTSVDGTPSAAPPRPPVAFLRPLPVLPNGWNDYHDPTGFSLFVPKGWSRTQQGTVVYFHGPGHILGIDQTSNPLPDPLTHWQTKAETRVAQGDFPGYHQLRITPVNYFRRAADWEFTFTGANGPEHVTNRGFITSTSHAYGIYWQCRQATWPQAAQDLQLVFDSFRPAPDA